MSYVFDISYIHKEINVTGLPSHLVLSSQTSILFSMEEKLAPYFLSHFLSP